MGYGSLRRWLPRLAGVYLLGALAAVAAPGFEVFPVFCWFLFPVVPGYEARYELTVTEAGGVRPDAPTDIQQLDEFDDPKAMDLWVVTQRLGKAVARKDEAGVAAARRLLEGSYLCAPSRYAMTELHFDPVERWRSGAVQSSRILASFSSTEGCETSPWTR